MLGIEAFPYRIMASVDTVDDYQVQIIFVSSQTCQFFHHETERKWEREKENLRDSRWQERGNVHWQIFPSALLNHTQHHSKGTNKTSLLNISTIYWITCVSMKMIERGKKKDVLPQTSYALLLRYL